MMVCPYDDERLLLILQVDHSKVAGWFAAHWGNDSFARPSPYAAMVLAAQEHDTGWWDWEIKPQLNSEGLPPDYIGSIKHLGGKVWLDFYRHGIDRLAEQDPYAGYIVSLHADGLLTQGRGSAPVYAGLYRLSRGQRISRRAGELSRELLRQLQKLRGISRSRFRRTILDEFQIDGSLRSDGAVRLQSLSVQQHRSARMVRAIP